MLKEADMTNVSVGDVATFIGREVPKVLCKSSDISTDQALTAPLRLPPIIQQLLEKVVDWASQQQKFEVHDFKNVPGRIYSIILLYTSL